MSEIPRSYLRLFNSATDAIALIDEMNFGLARETLKKGQIWAEELYIAEQEGELTNEKEIEIFLRATREKAKAERELAEREADESIDAKIRECMKKQAETPAN